MQQMQATVTRRRTLCQAVWEIQVTCPESTSLPQSGQFFMAAGPSYLRHPLFSAGTLDDGFNILVKAGPDINTAWLASRAPGDVLDLIGPLGHGFTLSSHAQRWLVVAESTPDVGPTLPLIHSVLANRAEVTLVTGAAQASAVFPARELPATVELLVTTADGSWGRRGSPIDLASGLLAWADRLVAVGSHRLYAGLARKLHDLQLVKDAGFAEILLMDVPMACGVGACHACAVERGQAVCLACQEGPVFRLTDVAGEMARLESAEDRF